jgi:hypothetical protein
MKRIRVITMMAALGLAATSGLAVAVPAAVAAPTATAHASPANSGPSGCTYGDGGNVKTCANIQNGGSGNYVLWMNVDGCVLGSGEWIHEEVAGPGIPNMNSATTYRSHGNCGIPETPTFYSYLCPGYYYFTTWRKNPNGSYTDVGQVALYLPPGSPPSRSC